MATRKKVGRKVAGRAVKARKAAGKAVKKATKPKVLDVAIMKSAVISYKRERRHCQLEFTGCLRKGKPYVRMRVLK